MTTETRKIYSVLNKIQAELASLGIGKESTNQQQGYRYRGIDQVMNSVGPLLAKHGVIIAPRYSDMTRQDRVTSKGTTMIAVSLKCEVDFICADDGSALTPAPSAFGEAFDSGDKATGKAQSYAFREILVKTFCIPVEGSEGDADHSTHEESRPAPQPKATAPAKPKDIEWLLAKVQRIPESAASVFRAFGLIKEGEPYTAIKPESFAGWTDKDWMELANDCRQRAEDDGQLPGAEVAQAPAAADVVEEVSTKSGTTKNGKPFTRYGVKINGTWHNTFDKKLHDLAESLKGSAVRFVAQPTNFGSDLKSIAAV